MEQRNGNTQTFTGVSPDAFAKVQQKVTEKLGITISGNAGAQSKKGVTVAWNYDGTSVLTITSSRSWYDPSEEVIEDAISELIKEVTA